MEARSRNRLIIVTGIVLVLLAVLLWRSSTGSLSYFKTVTELKAEKGLIGKTVKVGGEVVKGSVKRREDGVDFTISDKKSTIKISYDGTIPSTFGEGIQVIADGKYDKEDLVKADSLVTKCPSKYKSEKIETK
jgi:cytochrome c-type biogenesis protein CcmE